MLHPVKAVRANVSMSRAYYGARGRAAFAYAAQRTAAYFAQGAVWSRRRALMVGFALQAMFGGRPSVAGVVAGLGAIVVVYTATFLGHLVMAPARLAALRDGQLRERERRAEAELQQATARSADMQSHADAEVAKAQQERDLANAKLALVAERRRFGMELASRSSGIQQSLHLPRMGTPMALIRPDMSKEEREAEREARDAARARHVQAASIRTQKALDQIAV